MGMGMLNIIVRSVATILVGVLLLMQREVIIPIIVQCIGTAFILPSLFVLVSYLLNKNTGTMRKEHFPITLFTSLGSLVFGLWLLLTPAFFVEILMILLGVLISLMGLYQIVSLILARRILHVPLVMYIMPLALVVVGLSVLLNPFDAASLPFILLGVGAVIGGVSDLLTSILILYRRKQHLKENNTRIEIIEQ